MENVEEMRALFETIRNDLNKLQTQISAVDRLLQRFDQCNQQTSVGSYAQRRTQSLDYYKQQYESLHGPSTECPPSSEGFDEID